MILGLLYFLVLICVLIIPAVIIIYVFYNFYCEIKGAPFVPTSTKDIQRILSAANLESGQIFYELGCGDGRVIRFAVKKYGVNAVGVDLNLLLIIFCKIISKLQNLKKIEFRRENIFKTKLRKAEVIFLFMMPATLEKLKAKFLRECKNGTLIISHGFRIKGFESKLTKKLEHHLYPTYFYKISRYDKILQSIA